MGHKFVDIKFTDPDTKDVSFGKVSEDSLERWLAKGYEPATAEEIEQAKAPRPTDDVEVTDEDLEQGVVLDQPVVVEGQDPVVVDDDQPPAPAPGDVPPNSDVPPVVGDSTAGDDADSDKPDEQPSRGSRRNR